MYGNQNYDSLKRDKEYYQSEFERLQFEREEQQKRAYRESEERRREQQREYQESLCQANDWSEAFNKAIIRLGKEASEEQRDNAIYANDPEWANTLTTFFTDELAATKRASTLYYQSMKEVEDEIQQIRQKALNQVADQIEKEFPKSPLVTALRENDFETLVNW